MDNYKETFETWDKVARLYQDKFMHLDLYNESYDCFYDSIKKANAQLLEIGCGPGNITKYLLSKRPDFSILGTDIAPTMIQLAKNNNPSARFEVMDARQISTLNTRYDGIICGFCLPYLSPPDVLKLIQDCNNLLNANGILYISFVEGEPDKSGFQTGSSGDRVFLYYYSLIQLTSQLNECHLEVTKSFSIPYKKTETSYETHVVLVARKN